MLGAGLGIDCARQLTASEPHALVLSMTEVMAGIN